VPVVAFTWSAWPIFNMAACYMSGEVLGMLDSSSDSESEDESDGNYDSSKDDVEMNETECK